MQGSDRRMLTYGSRKHTFHQGPRGPRTDDRDSHPARPLFPNTAWLLAIGLVSACGRTDTGAAFLEHSVLTDSPSGNDSDTQTQQVTETDSALADTTETNSIASPSSGSDTSTTEVDVSIMEDDHCQNQVLCIHQCDFRPPCISACRTHDPMEKTSLSTTRAFTLQSCILGACVQSGACEQGHLLTAACVGCRDTFLFDPLARADACPEADADCHFTD